MFRIGEFSRIARVTIETLRHYDALGLLKPAQIDPFTGYRYYSARQLQTLNRILVLKASGFALGEIGRILHDDLSNAELRGLLTAQLLAAERDLQVAQARRAQLQARLQYLDLEDRMPAYEVSLKPVPAVTLAAVRTTVPSVEQMPAHCQAMFAQIGGWLAANRLPFGPTLTIYHTDEYRQADIDTECAFILPDAAAAQAAPPPPAPLALRQLTAEPLVAFTVVTDDFFARVDGLTPAYQALARWIEANHYHIVGPARELFYGSPHSGDFTAEIQFPVAN